MDSLVEVQLKYEEIRDAHLNFFVDFAERICKIVHRGQLDKAGLPYADHPLRMGLRAKDRIEQIVCYLHDTIEDHPDMISLEFYEDFGFPPVVMGALEAITRMQNESHAHYLRRVKANQVAFEVKKLDIEDNLGAQRLGKLPVEHREYFISKYAYSKKVLGIE